MKTRVMLAFLAGSLLLPASVGVAETLYKAKGRVFLGTGPSTQTLRSSRQYYFALNWSDRSILVYNRKKDLVGRIGSFGQAPEDFLAPWAITVDREGNVYVADRGANQIKIFDKKGEFLRAIPYKRPRSVAVLSTGEICVVGYPHKGLISILDSSGHLVREIGETVQVVPEPKLNAFLNSGKLAVDDSDNIYFAFTWLPKPTVRKYDKTGRLVVEFHPYGQQLEQASQRARQGIERRLVEGGIGGSAVIFGLGIDPKTKDIWVSSGGWIHRYDKSGNPKDTMHFVDQDGRPINVDEILMHDDQVYVVCRVTGVYEFDYPAETRR